MYFPMKSNMNKLDVTTAKILAQTSCLSRLICLDDWLGVATTAVYSQRGLNRAWLND